MFDKPPGRPARDVAAVMLLAVAGHPYTDAITAEELNDRITRSNIILLYWPLHVRHPVASAWFLLNQK